MSTPTYVALASATVGSGGAGTITFSNIPQTYTDLLIVMSLRDTVSAVNNAGCRVMFNQNTSNYSVRNVYGNGTSAISNSASSQSWIAVGQQPGATATASTFSNDLVYIPNYTQSINKSIAADSVGENNGTTAFQYLAAGLWANTAAITTIELQSNSTAWAQHSTATLYGIKNS